MGLREVDQGRRAEQVVARLLNRWAGGRYTFRRRGLGQRGLPDLVAVAREGERPWPFVISVKGGKAPGIRQLLERGGAGREWGWWREVCNQPVLLVGQEEQRRAPDLTGGWLTWRSERAWWLGMRVELALSWRSLLAGLYLPLKPKPVTVFDLEWFLATVSVGAVYHELVMWYQTGGEEGAE